MATVYGIFEGCIGVEATSLADLLSYYKLQGYEPAGEPGCLNAVQAQELYGVCSALKSVRLRHKGGADHGLLRLMVWAKPTGPGLGTQAMATRGGRWTVSLTDDVMGIANHAYIASTTEPDTRHVPPQWTVIYGGGKEGLQAFKGPLVGVRETLFFRPLTRQVFFQRWGYEIPSYGTTTLCLLRTSQVTHFGLIVEADSNDDPEIQFYESALGLLRARDCREPCLYKAGDDAATAMWEFLPGTTGNYNIDFDDRRSSTDWKLARSGRLVCAATLSCVCVTLDSNRVGGSFIIATTCTLLLTVHNSITLPPVPPSHLNPTPCLHHHHHPHTHRKSLGIRRTHDHHSTRGLQSRDRAHSDFLSTRTAAPTSRVCERGCSVTARRTRLPSL